METNENKQRFELKKLVQLVSITMCDTVVSELEWK